MPGPGRIDFTGLTDFISQFADAKGHFFKSQREFLLAMRSVVDVLAKASRGRGLDPFDDGATNVLLILRTVIDYLLAKFPDDTPGASAESKLEALRSVVEVLEAEERRLLPFAEDEIVSAKIEAIHAIAELVRREMDQIRSEAEAEKKTRIRKVTID